MATSKSGLEWVVVCCLLLVAFAASANAQSMFRSEDFDAQSIFG
jgi:hypothetical protein